MFLNHSDLLWLHPPLKFNGNWVLFHSSCLIFKHGIWSQLGIGLNLILVFVNKKEQSYLPQKVILRINKRMHAKQGQAHGKRYKTNSYYYDLTVICVINLLKHWEVKCHDVCTLLSNGSRKEKKVYMERERERQMLTTNVIRWKYTGVYYTIFIKLFTDLKILNKKYERKM